MEGLGGVYPALVEETVYGAVEELGYDGDGAGEG